MNKQAEKLEIEKYIPTKEELDILLEFGEEYEEYTGSIFDVNYTVSQGFEVTRVMITIALGGPNVTILLDGSERGFYELRWWGEHETVSDYHGFYAALFDYFEESFTARLK